MNIVQLGLTTNSQEEKPSESSNLEKAVSAQILTFIGNAFF